MMLSKCTLCEREQCSLVNLAFQLVCWDSLGLMEGPCVFDILSVLCVVMDRGK